MTRKSILLLERQVIASERQATALEKLSEWMEIKVMHERGYLDNVSSITEQDNTIRNQKEYLCEAQV